MIVKIQDYPGKHFSICILTTTSYFCVDPVRPNTWQHTSDPRQGLPAGPADKITVISEILRTLRLGTTCDMGLGTRCYGDRDWVEELFVSHLDLHLMSGGIPLSPRGSMNGGVSWRNM